MGCIGRFRPIRTCGWWRWADPVDEGRAELAAICDAERSYADYREMLEREQPDIVVIARHWYDDGRVEETLAAIEAGARGLYVEKADFSLARTRRGP